MKNIPVQTYTMLKSGLDLQKLTPVIFDHFRQNNDWTGKWCEDGILKHQLNSGGGEAIIKTGVLKGADGLYGNSPMARAKPVEVEEKIVEDVVYFCTSSIPTNGGFCGNLTGIQWKGDLQLGTRLLVQKNGEILVKGLSDIDWKKFHADVNKKCRDNLT